MERPQRATIAGIVLIILNAVGIAGFSIEAWEPLFKMLTPFNLILTNVLLGIFHTSWNKRFVFWAFLTFLAGFMIEVAGVQTGLVFGEYEYLDVLGLKVFGVPLLIGANWLMLVYVAGVLLQSIRTNILFKAVLGASLLTFLDFLMEPVAIEFDFWTWFGQEPPLQNFMAWWLIAFMLMLGFFYHIKQTLGTRNLEFAPSSENQGSSSEAQVLRGIQNPFAKWVLASQVLFFGGLWLI